MRNARDLMIVARARMWLCGAQVVAWSREQEVRRKTCSALRFHDSFDSSMPDPDGESDLDMTSFYELVDENGKNVFKCLICSRHLSRKQRIGHLESIHGKGIYRFLYYYCCSFC